MKTKTFIFIVAIFGLLLTGCAVENPTEEITGSSTEAYPVQGEETSYPVEVFIMPEDEGYPIKESTPFYEQGPEFELSTPILGGDSIVTGTGPANVPIRLVDVTEMGFVLDQTVIESDGTFKFTPEVPLQSGHSIGIQLGDIEGTDLDESDFLYSETYYERPLIGILFDLVVVE